MNEKEIILQQEREIRSLEKTVVSLLEGKKFEKECPTRKDNRELWLKNEMLQREVSLLHAQHEDTQKVVAEVIKENQRLKKITDHFGHKKTRK
jgi:hypothetical protein